MEQQIQEDILKTLIEVRDNHYKLMATIKRKNVMNASLSHYTRITFEKMIDVLDLLMYGKDPRKISDGIWDKWYRD